MSDNRSGGALQQAASTLQRSADATRQSEIARANSWREGSTVREVGDVGTLVIPHWAALTLGLA